MDIFLEVNRIIDSEIESIRISQRQYGDSFLNVVQAIYDCRGKIILTGMGKAGHVARKIAATLSSLGTQSIYMHPAEALHGDLGMIDSKDIVLAFSNSGESEEVTRLIPSIKRIGALLIAISGNKNSTLVKHSDISQVFENIKEACSLGIAPTASTTVQLVFGDVLAIVLSQLYGFSKDNFGIFHPAGTIGKKILMTVYDVMKEKKDTAYFLYDDSLINGIIQMGKKGLGIITIIDDQEKVIGVVTDGDIRRKLEQKADIYTIKISEIMSQSPIIIDESLLAVDSLNILQSRNITCAPVINNKGKYVGVIRIQELVSGGIVSIWKLNYSSWM